VLTTGATLHTCAEVIQAAGAACVSGAVVAATRKSLGET